MIIPGIFLSIAGKCATCVPEIKSPEVSLVPRVGSGLHHRSRKAATRGCVPILGSE
jgi:hypothetical protein